MSTAPLEMVSVHDLYDSLGGAAPADVELVAAVADRVQVPREEPANSFVLHAPLELLARAALLPWVRSDGREIARLRIAALLAEYEAEPATEPERSARPSDDPTAAAPALAAALHDGDLEAADRAAQQASVAIRPHELAPLLGDTVLPGLAAAGHAPIFLYQFPRVSPRGEITMRLLRPLVRELARYPQLTLEWMHGRPTCGTGSAASLAEVLADVPRLGVPGSTFIFPVMHQVDDHGVDGHGVDDHGVDGSGVAAELLGPTLDGISVDAASKTLLRAAARAMLVGSIEHVPYGWTHALTMPQAALGVARASANPQLGIDVAGTYVVGMLAALAAEPLPRDIELADPGGSFVDALSAGRDAAAGWVWNAAPEAIATLRSDLATRGSAHRDAHVVKYTLACLDQAAADPEAERLYLAAAAALLGFWAPVRDADDPLLAHVESMRR